MNRISHFLFLAALLVFFTACGNKEKEQDAGVFTVSAPGSVTAEAQSVSVAVRCDLQWKAALQGASWARMTQTSDGVQISLEMNKAEEARTGRLVITAGKQEKTVSIKQEGLTSIIKPLALEISGTTPGRLDIHLKQSWEAVTDATWLSLEREEGSGGLSRVKVIPADGNENVGSREGSVVIKLGSESITIPVTQGQTDALRPPARVFGASAAEGERSFPVEANVDFDISIPTSVKWVQVVSTKALDTHMVVLHFDENRSGKTREAGITLSHGSLSEEVTVRQMYKHAVMEKQVPGAYGILPADFLYQSGTSQWSWRQKEDGCAFRILQPANHQVLDLGGIPAMLRIGDSFQLRMLLRDGIYTSYDAIFPVNVVDLQDGKAWLAVSGSKGFIIQTETL